MTVAIPARFRALPPRGATWPSWLDQLPKLVAAVLRDWQLTVDGTPLTGECALVLPVRTAAREPAAVKFGWPHEDSDYEHLALREWSGEGAVRLLRADPRRQVLLMERADSSRDLTAIPVLEACQVVADLYPRLHRPALPQLRRLSGCAGRWADELSTLRGHPLVPRRYVEQAAALCRDFAVDSDTDGVMLHTDLHYFNVLAAEREPWLVIDPKPMSGESAYEIAPLLWNRWDEAVASGDVRGEILNRFYAVVDAAQLDEQRARDWVVVREMVNVLWELQDAGAAGESGSSPAALKAQVDPDWLTIAITIVKAIQR